ncbi:MAG: hypothetical protein ABR936_15140 [Bacteroidota bacterium]|jgi:hypothetical protein
MKTSEFNAAIILFITVFSISVAHGQLNVKGDTSQIEFPVIVYFGIEAGNIDPLNVSVSMDGNNFINQDFSNSSDTHVDTTKSGKIITSITLPHRHWPFTLTLKESIHQITATTKNGDAGLDVVFTVEKPLWLILSYWGKNHFQLHISERGVGFQ